MYYTINISNKLDAFKYFKVPRGSYTWIPLFPIDDLQLFIILFSELH